MNEKSKHPEIRITGYTEPWKQSNVGQLIEDYFEKTLIKNQYPVLTSSQRQGVLLQVDYFADKQVTTDDNIGYFILPKSYFTYRSRSDTDLFVFNRNDIIERGIISCYYPVFRVKDTDSNFFLRRINHGMARQLAMAAEGTGQRVLAHDKFKNMITFVPTAGEQMRIGILFERLDKIITLQQKKIEKLEIVKKSMLMRMFPKVSSAVPEIRFAGFSEVWKKCKLIDLCVLFTDGDWIESKDQSNSGVRLVQTGNIGIAEYLDKPNNRKWISEGTFIRLNCEEVLPGDILISRLPYPAGRACIMPYLGAKMITSVDCTIVRIAPDCSNKFMIQYLSTQDYFNEVNTALAGGTRQRIGRSNLACFLIPIPTKYGEQKAIGEYFEKIDNLISLHQRKLEKLKNIKKSMLTKMFVSGG